MYDKLLMAEYQELHRQAKKEEEQMIRANLTLRPTGRCA
jgi:hypothetical protein